MGDYDFDEIFEHDYGLGYVRVDDILGNDVVIFVESGSAEMRVSMSLKRAEVLLGVLQGAIDVVRNKQGD